MRRKLVLLNLVLVALIGAAAWRLRVEWVAAKKHEIEVLGRKQPPAPAPPYQPLQPAPPVMATSYAPIAQKDLFSKDRNPMVVVDAPPPPPPPKPMPALPVLRGMMSFPGDGPTVIMSDNPKSASHEIRIGEKVGEFTLLAVNKHEIVLEWDGREVRRKPEDLMDRTVPEAAPEPAAPRAGLNAAPAARSLMVTPPAGPGADMGKDGMRNCVLGDTSPPGTVVDGMRKVTWNSPFGQGCRWDPVTK